MILRISTCVLLVGIAGCAGSRAPATTFLPTQDPVTKLIEAEPAEVLAAAVVAFRGFGFQIQPAAPGARTVYSNSLTLQSNWRDRSLAERIRCGIGTAADSDPARVTQVTNTMPIDLSLGVEVEPRPSRIAATILFSANGRRSGGDLLTSPTMPCTLTVNFVEEIFGAIEEELASRQAAAPVEATGERS